VEGLNPKKIFLIDGLGAALSSFLIGVVGVHYADYIGMPQIVLYILAVIPVFFVLFDFLCFFYIKEIKSNLCLRIIALLNFLYCILSLIFMLYHSKALSIFVWGYFSIEIILVLFLIRFELKVAKNSEIIN
jgi:hypothetical protein